MRTPKGLVAALLVSLAALGGAPARAAAAPFSNPVIPGNVADPSVVRADGAYWAAATSDMWAPVFPLYRSTDLVHWQQVGAIFPRPPRWARGKFWAPGLSVSPQGRWSVYYSARRHGGKPCLALAQASRPTGPWRDRGFVHCEPAGSIDPALVTDASGTPYLVWKMMGVGNGIYGAQLSPAGDRLVGQPVRLTVPNEPWEQGVTEGPDIVRDGDAYVLVYSGGHCCRPPCSYAVGVARSDNILGPYSKDPENPVFHGGNGWKCPGHGTLVDGPDGSLTFLHHAYESDDPFDVHRQALLDPVVFGADGWPVFGDNGAPIASDGDEDGLSFVDVFAGHALGPGWQWPYDGPPHVVVRGGLLHIRSGQVSRTWVPRNFVAEADIRGRGRLTMLLTDGRQVGVSAARRSVAAISGLRTIARAPIDATALALHVRSGQAVGAYARRPGGRWTRLGPAVLAPRGAAVDRVVLSSGTYGEVRLRPLGRR